MRALWERHGRIGGRVAGVVDRPYTMDDVKAALASVAGDAEFANDFVARYIEGREVPDYAPLVARAGLLWRPVATGRAYAGALRIQDDSKGARIAAAVPFGSPAYEAGLDRDDLIVSVGGTAVSSGADVDRLI